MLRATLTSCLLGVLVLPTSGCMTCCEPAMPWDAPFYGCVETGPLGRPRPGLAEKREMRRALRHSFGMSSCPTCGAFDGGMIDGYDAGAGISAYSNGGTCPTCQQNMQMNSSMYGSQPPYGSEMQPHPMNLPTPVPAMEPTPAGPAANPMGPTTTPPAGILPGPTAAPNSTSQFYPTGAWPTLPHTASAIPASMGNPQTPPQVQPFQTRSSASATYDSPYSPAPVQGQSPMMPMQVMSMQTGQQQGPPHMVMQQQMMGQQQMMPTQMTMQPQIMGQPQMAMPGQVVEGQAGYPMQTLQVPAMGMPSQIPVQQTLYAPQ